MQSSRQQHYEDVLEQNSKELNQLPPKLKFCNQPRVPRPPRQDASLSHTRNTQKK